MSSDKLSIIKINNRKVKMQTNKKTLSDHTFDIANSINTASRVANLYGKLFAIKDMQIYLLKEEKKIKDEIEREEKK